MSIETKNARIRSTFLGVEDHGFLTAFIQLDYGDASQSYGGYGLGVPSTGKFTPSCSMFICGVLRVIGVEKWEDLAGKNVRVKSDHCKVHEIGHIIDDRWYNHEQEFKKLKEPA